MFVTVKHSEKIYRVRHNDLEKRHFGQIKRNGRKWEAEIRETASGVLVRFAGVWDRKKDAVEEVESLLSKPEHQ